MELSCNQDFLFLSASDRDARVSAQVAKATLRAALPATELVAGSVTLPLKKLGEAMWVFTHIAFAHHDGELRAFTDRHWRSVDWEAVSAADWSSLDRYLAALEEARQAAASYMEPVPLDVGPHHVMWCGHHTGRYVRLDVDQDTLRVAWSVGEGAEEPSLFFLVKGLYGLVFKEEAMEAFWEALVPLAAEEMLATQVAKICRWQRENQDRWLWRNFAPSGGCKIRPLVAMDMSALEPATAEEVAEA